MTFQTFTPKEYLKIDIAGNFGLDKEDWNDRIAWFDRNEHQLHSLISKAEEPALFYAGILAWESALEGKPSGYPISLDATCSGIQILAALACDRRAAQICNVVDNGKRMDAYTTIYHDMVNRVGEMEGEYNDIQQKMPDGSFKPVKYKIDRKKIKQAIMTAFYSSTAVPKRVFGEGELLNIFYDTVKDNAPGAWEINETMLAIWDPNALVYEWVLPDNFHVKIKVMGQVTENVHFLNEPFEVTRQVNMPIKGGRSLGAHKNHSIDGMMVREMQRRCSYNPQTIQNLNQWIANGNHGLLNKREQDVMVQCLWDHYLDSGFLSARILTYLDNLNLGLIETSAITRLIQSLPAKPFEVMSIHDCFRCLPSYGNDLRRQYNNLLAEIAESNLLSYIVSQICKRPIQAGKLDPSMVQDIRETNYALS